MVPANPTPAGAIPPDRLSRVLGLLHYLLDEERGEEIPVEQLTRDLGITPAELQADLGLLNLVNHGGGTYLLYASLEDDVISVSRETLSDTYARPARLTPLLAKALRLALDLLGDTMTGEGLASLSEIRGKIDEVLPPDAHAGDVEIVDTAAADAEVLQALRDAIAAGAVVRLEYYTASRDALTCRDVEPHYLVHGGPGWYMEGYCRSAGEPRTFRVDRIRSAVVTEERFERRGEVTLDRRPAHPEGWQQARHALVRFPASKRRYLEEEGLSVEDAGPALVTAELPYADADWLIRRVLSEAGEAELLEPADLRPAVARAARELAAKYASEPEDA